MILKKTDLSDDEEIVRIFARRPKELNTATPVSVRGSDFDRRMDQMSGISMWRASAKERGREVWQTSWKKGILIAKAKPLISLGLEFYHTGNDHFTVRCHGCDLSPNQNGQEPLCMKTGGELCDFDPDRVTQLKPKEVVPIGLRDRLAQVFKIDTLPY